MAKYPVATVGEIPPGQRKIVEVAGRSIGIFNIGGEFFALRNRCPHQGGPLCLGQVSGLVVSAAPGQYDYSRQGEIVRCPWHGWEFDIKTGRSYIDPAKVRVRRYEVTVERSEISDAAQKERASPPGGESYVAETYPVSVEQQSVVVEIPT